VIVRLALVYLIGLVSLGVGFYQFWRRGLVDQNAFLIGTTCLVAAAVIQVVRGLWHQLKRR
jgi:hypothetical protein